MDGENYAVIIACRFLWFTNENLQQLISHKHYNRTVQSLQNDHKFYTNKLETDGRKIY